MRVILLSAFALFSQAAAWPQQIVTKVAGTVQPAAIQAVAETYGALSALAACPLALLAPPPPPRGVSQSLLEFVFENQGKHALDRATHSLGHVKEHGPFSQSQTAWPHRYMFFQNLKTRLDFEGDNVREAITDCLEAVVSLVTGLPLVDSSAVPTATGRIQDSHTPWLKRATRSESISREFPGVERVAGWISELQVVVDTKEMWQAIVLPFHTPHVEGESPDAEVVYGMGTVVAFRSATYGAGRPGPAMEQRATLEEKATLYEWPSDDPDSKVPERLTRVVDRMMQGLTEEWDPEVRRSSVQSSSVQSSWSASQLELPDNGPPSAAFAEDSESIVTFTRSGSVFGARTIPGEGILHAIRRARLATASCSGGKLSNIDSTIVFTGRHLGGSAALLASHMFTRELVSEGYDAKPAALSTDCVSIIDLLRVNSMVATFDAPRVGNEAWVRRYISDMESQWARFNVYRFVSPSSPASFTHYPDRVHVPGLVVFGLTTVLTRERTKLFSPDQRFFMVPKPLVCDVTSQLTGLSLDQALSLDQSRPYPWSQAAFAQASDQDRVALLQDKCLSIGRLATRIKRSTSAAKRLRVMRGQLVAINARLDPRRRNPWTPGKSTAKCVTAGGTQRAACREDNPLDELEPSMSAFWGLSMEAMSRRSGFAAVNYFATAAHPVPPALQLVATRDALEMSPADHFVALFSTEDAARPSLEQYFAGWQAKLRLDSNPHLSWREIAAKFRASKALAMSSKKFPTTILADMRPAELPVLMTALVTLSPGLPMPPPAHDSDIQTDFLYWGVDYDLSEEFFYSPRVREFRKQHLSSIPRKPRTNLLGLPLPFSPSFTLANAKFVAAQNVMGYNGPIFKMPASGLRGFVQQFGHFPPSDDEKLSSSVSSMMLALHDQFGTAFDAVSPERRRFRNEFTAAPAVLCVKKRTTVGAEHHEQRLARSRKNIRPMDPENHQGWWTTPLYEVEVMQDIDVWCIGPKPSKMTCGIIGISDYVFQTDGGKKGLVYHLLEGGHFIGKTKTEQELNQAISEDQPRKYLACQSPSYDQWMHNG
jgi:hypothetical protein